MPRMTALKSLGLENFWRADLEESAPAGKLLYRRGAGPKHMLRETPPAPSSYIPAARSSGPGRRRNFSEADKRRIVEKTCCEGASASGVARRYGVGTRSLFSWKQALAPGIEVELVGGSASNAMSIPRRCAA